MKKSFFLSILAVGALVAGCAKSEIVDTKFNEEITFENYVGRDAMTKATPYGSTNLPSDLGLYGYYLGNLTAWNNGLDANLWVNERLQSSTSWVTTTPRYWANDTDNYTFLAYAPCAPYSIKVDDADVNILTIATTTGEKGSDPAVTYDVPTNLKQQIDLLYSNNNRLIQKPESGAVTLNLQHALARLTVTAKIPASAEPTPFTFCVKEVKISGKFNTTGSFNLYSGQWNPTPNSVAYSFYSDEDNTVALTEKGTDYAGADNYLMMIPTVFSADSPATLYVKYTTFYEGQESTPIEKELEITQPFDMGKAYAINLEFSKTTQAITFTVTCDDWVTDQNPQTNIPGGNPHEGTDWE